MSEGVDTWRAFYEAFNRGAFGDAVQFLHPEVELSPALPALEGSNLRGNRYRGRAEVKEFLETISNAWETLTVELEETIEEGDRVLAVENWRARGRDGIEIKTRLIDVYTFRDGLVVRVDGFRDKAEAREAAGLTEASD
jgi:ketosteroid isomerase-like protein